LQKSFGESSLADTGANGCKQAEERVRTKHIEITIVEVARIVKLIAGVAGLRLGSVDASQVGVVEDLQSQDAKELASRDRARRDGPDSAAERPDDPAAKKT
jgi:hypothetical protein